MPENQARHGNPHRFPVPTYNRAFSVFHFADLLGNVVHAGQRHVAPRLHRPAALRLNLRRSERRGFPLRPLSRGGRPPTARWVRDGAFGHSALRAASGRRWAFSPTCGEYPRRERRASAGQRRSGISVATAATLRQNVRPSGRPRARGTAEPNGLFRPWPGGACLSLGPLRPRSATGLARRGNLSGRPKKLERIHAQCLGKLVQHVDTG